MLAAAWVALRRLAGQLAGARPASEDALLGLLALLRREAGIVRPVRLFVAPRLRVPIAVGTLFPRVYLPPRALELRSELQESMLAHELAHIARLALTPVSSGL